MNRHLEHDWFPEPLPENISLGERTWLYSSFAFRHYHSQRPMGLRVEHNSGLYDGTFFDLGPKAEVTIGCYCTIVGAIICCNSRVEIHDYALIAHEVVIADSFAAVPDWSRAPSPTDNQDISQNPKTSVVIGENAWIGARAILLDGARIGIGSIVGASAVVDFEVPAYSVVAGNPACIVKRLRS